MVFTNLILLFDRHMSNSRSGNVLEDHFCVNLLGVALHLFSKLRDLCSWHLKGISCVLSAINQTSDDLFLFKKAQNDLKVSTVGILQKERQVCFVSEFTKQGFCRSKPFSYLIDGSQNTENETSHEQCWSHNFENRCNTELSVFIQFCF